MNSVIIGAMIGGAAGNLFSRIASKVIWHYLKPKLSKQTQQNIYGW